MLSVFEELFLLALDEESGRSLSFAKKTLAHGLSGGILAELAFLEKICANEKHRLELVNPALTGDVILDDAIEEIHSSEKLRRTSYWVSQLSSRPKKLRERIGERLASRELLTRDDRRFFWPTSSGVETTPQLLTKYEMKSPLRACILSNGVCSPRDLALLSMASASGLLNLIFTQDELPIARYHIQEKVVRDALANPVMQTIEEIEQAIVSSLEDDMD
jgi:hypothetical protein